MTVHARGLLFVALLAAAGCDDATTATSPTVTSPVTELFSGQFIPCGSAARAFTAASAAVLTGPLILGQLADAYGLRFAFGLVPLFLGLAAVALAMLTRLPRAAVAFSR